jgi:hypothetical protein
LLAPLVGSMMILIQVPMALEQMPGFNLLMESLSHPMVCLQSLPTRAIILSATSS